MSESNWGLKRNCPKCSVWFYDFLKVPIICPGCEESFTATDFMKLKLSRNEYEVSVKKKEEIGSFTDEAELDDKKLIIEDTIEDTEELSDNIEIKAVKSVDDSS